MSHESGSATDLQLEAGGHWFEPSTARLIREPKVLLIEGFWLFFLAPGFPL